MLSQEKQNGKRWIGLFFAFLFRDPVILIAVCATFLEEVGYDLPWFTLLFVCLTNFFVIRLFTRLVQDTVCLCLDVFSALWKWQKGRMRKVARSDIQMSKDSTLGVVAP